MAPPALAPSGPAEPERLAVRLPRTSSLRRHAIHLRRRVLQFQAAACAAPLNATLIPQEVRKVGAHASVRTDAPYPFFPPLKRSAYDTNGARQQGGRPSIDAGPRKTASFKATGTVPFRLRERHLGATVLVRNFTYCGQIDATSTTYLQRSATTHTRRSTVVREPM